MASYQEEQICSKLILLFEEKGFSSKEFNRNELVTIKLHDYLFPINMSKEITEIFNISFRLRVVSKENNTNYCLTLSGFYGKIRAIDLELECVNSEINKFIAIVDKLISFLTEKQFTGYLFLVSKSGNSREKYCEYSSYGISVKFPVDSGEEDYLITYTDETSQKLLTRDAA